MLPGLPDLVRRIASTKRSTSSVGGEMVEQPQHVPDGILPYEGSRRLSEYLEVMVEYEREVLAVFQRSRS